MKPFSLIFLVALLACNGRAKKEKQEETILQNKVLNTHDKVMPQMENLVHKKQELKNIGLMLALDSFKKKHKSIDTAALNARINLAVSNLDSADHSIMDWMHQFNPQTEKMTHSEIMHYLEGQLRKINRVDAAFQKAIRQSDSIIKQVNEF